MTDEEKFSEEEYKLAEEVIKPIYRNAMQNDFSFAKYGVECYQAGLKAGRPQWHKVADGDLPKEMENVLCYCKGAGIKFCCVGHIIVGGDKKARWWANNKSEELIVIKWKEIILDEEGEEND